jgi:O-antigen polysaccharide polymerase Wzy
MSKNIFRYLIGLHSFWLLAGIIPVFTVASLREIEIGVLPFLAFIIIILSSFRLSVFSIKNEKNIISMTFWIFVYVFLGLTPLLQLLSKNFPLEGSYNFHTLFTTFLIIFSGLLSYELGYWFGCINSTPITRTINIVTANRFISHKRTLLFSIISLFITIIAIWILGGLKAVLLSRDELLNQLMIFTEGESQARLQILSTLLRVPIFISLILLWSIWLHDRNRPNHENKIKIWNNILLLAMLLMNLLINNPISSARYWFGTIVLSLIFLTISWSSKISFSFLTILITLSLIILFPLADMFRHTTNIDKTVVLESSNITYPLVNGDYDSFQQILNTTEYVEDNGIAFGKHMFGTLTFWIPRNLWRGKPIASGIMVAEYKNYDYTNLSMPLWGEAYMDGGIPGVVLIFAIYGFFISIIEILYTNNYLHGWNFLNIFVPVYAAYQLFLLRGTLMSTFAYFVPIVIFMFFGTKREHAIIF